MYPCVDVATKGLLLLAEVEGLFVRIEENNVFHQLLRPFAISEVTDEQSRNVTPSTIENGYDNRVG